MKDSQKNSTHPLVLKNRAIRPPGKFSKRPRRKLVASSRPPKKLGDQSNSIKNL